MGCRQVAMHSALVPVLLVAGLAAPAAAFVSVPAQAKGQRPCLPDILSGALTAGAGSLLAPPPHRWRRCPQRAAGARRGRLEMTDAYLHLLPHSSGQTSWLFLPDVFVLVSSELQQKQPIIQIRMRTPRPTACRAVPSRRETCCTFDAASMGRSAPKQRQEAPLANGQSVGRLPPNRVRLLRLGRLQVPRLRRQVCLPPWSCR